MMTEWHRQMPDAIIMSVNVHSSTVENSAKEIAGVLDYAIENWNADKDRIILVGGCTCSGNLSHNVTDDLYLGLIVGGILNAVTQAVKVIHDCRQTVFGGLLGSVGDSQVILRFGFRFVGGLDGVIGLCGNKCHMAGVRAPLCLCHAILIRVSHRKLLCREAVRLMRS